MMVSNFKVKRRNDSDKFNMEGAIGGKVTCKANREVEEWVEFKSILIGTFLSPNFIWCLGLVELNKNGGFGN